MTIDPGAGRGLRYSVVGNAGERLLATGLPPGRYLIVVLLRGIENADAARSAVSEFASAVLDGG